MAEASGSAPSVPAPAARHRCCGGGGGCGLGLARLVRRLRRQGRRALCAGAAAVPAARRLGCQYDPLSYARNFDLGDADADASRLYHSCSFSSRFVLAPSSSSPTAAAAGSAPSGISSRPIAAS